MPQKQVTARTAEDEAIDFLMGALEEPASAPAEPVMGPFEATPVERARARKDEAPTGDLKTNWLAEAQRAAGPKEKTEAQRIEDAQVDELFQLFGREDPSLETKFLGGVARGEALTARGPELAFKARDFGLRKAAEHLKKLPLIGEDLARGIGVTREMLDRWSPFTRKLAQDLDQWGRETEALVDQVDDPRFARQDIMSQVARGAGSTVPFAAVSGPLGLVAGPGIATIAQGLMGMAQMAVPMYEDVLAETGSEEKAWAAAAVGGGLGASDALGVGRIFAKLDRATGGAMRKVLEKIALGYVEEGFQEGGQTVGESVTKKVLTGKEIRFLDELAQGGESAFVGGIVGGGTTALHEGGGALAERVHTGPRLRVEKPGAPKSEEEALEPRYIEMFQPEGRGATGMAPTETEAPPAAPKKGEKKRPETEDEVVEAIKAGEELSAEELQRFPGALGRAAGEAIEEEAAPTERGDEEYRETRSAAEGNLPPLDWSIAEYPDGQVVIERMEGQERRPVTNFTEQETAAWKATEEIKGVGKRAQARKRVLAGIYRRLDPSLQAEWRDLLGETATPGASELAPGEEGEAQAEPSTATEAVQEPAGTAEAPGVLPPEEIEREIEEGIRGMQEIEGEVRRGTAAAISPEMAKESEESFIDDMTGLPNERADKRDTEKLLRERAPGTDVLRLELDVDDFKAINDLLGRPVGDEAIRVIGRKWREVLRAGDDIKLSRISGDEFTATMRVAAGTDPTGIRDRLEKAAADALAEADLDEVAGRKIGASVGFAFAEPGEDYETFKGRTSKEVKARKLERQGGVERPRITTAQVAEFGEGAREEFAKKRAAREQAKAREEISGRAEQVPGGAFGTEAAPASTATLGLRLGGESRLIPISDYAEASRIYGEFRERSNLGASELPRGSIVNFDTGETIATVSYNGRVWAGRSQLSKELLYDPSAKGTEPSVRAAPVSETEAGPEEAPGAPPAEPWQMTRADFQREVREGRNFKQLGINPTSLETLRGAKDYDALDRQAARHHEARVTMAVAAGEKVPADVLADYPTLVGKGPPAPKPDKKGLHSHAAKAKRLRDAAVTIREKANEEINRDRLENTPKRAREAEGIRGRARREIELADVMERLAAQHEEGGAGVLENVATRAQVEELLRLARLTEEDLDSEGNKRRAQPLPKWGAFVNPGNLKDVLKKAEGKKGVPALRKILGHRLADTEVFYLSTPGELDALRQLANMAEGDYSAKRILESIRDFERILKAGFESREALAKGVEAIRALRDQAPGLSEEQKKAARIKQLEAGVRFQKIPGFFATPPALVDELMTRAGIDEGMRVLEPSAGKGDLADAAREAGGKVDTVEPQQSLRKILEEKGHEIVGDFFMEMPRRAVYDRVVMNPPFENGQDIDHVRHAFGMLKPGGKLVAIMSEGPFGRQDKKATAFREWLDEQGGASEKVDSGSFKGRDVFRETGVAVRIVEIEKGGAEEEAAPQTPEQQGFKVEGFYGKTKAERPEPVSEKLASVAPGLPEFKPGTALTKDTLFYKQPGFDEHKAGTKRVSVRAAVHQDEPVFVVAMTFKTGEGVGTSGTPGESFSDPQAAVDLARKYAGLEPIEMAETKEKKRIRASLAAAKKHDEEVERERARKARAATAETADAHEKAARRIIEAFQPTATPAPEEVKPRKLSFGEGETVAFNAPAGQAGSGRLVDDEQNGLVRIFFDQKPSAEKLKELRDAGFRWQGAIKAWVRERHDEARRAAARIVGLKEGGTPEDMTADLERRIKELEDSRFRKRREKQREINRQIRTLEDQVAKLEPEVNERRRRREEAARQKEIEKLIAQDARTEVLLTKIGYSDAPQQTEAIETMRGWVRAEAKKAGIDDVGLIADLENEALRFYATNNSLDLPVADASKTSVAEFVALAADPLRLRAGLKEVSEQIAAAREDARQAGAQPDYTLEDVPRRIVREMKDRPAAEVLAAVRKEVGSRTGALRGAAQSKRASYITEEFTRRSTELRETLERTQTWEDFSGVSNPFLRAAWEGGFVTEDEGIYTDGRILVKKSAIQGAAAKKLFEKKNDAARYGQANPLPKRATDQVWAKAASKTRTTGEILGVFGARGDSPDLAMVRSTEKGPMLLAINATMLRALMRATKADGIFVNGPAEPVLITKGNEQVGVIMPISLELSAERTAAFMAGGLKGFREAAEKELKEAAAARDKALRELGRPTKATATVTPDTVDLPPQEVGGQQIPATEEELPPEVLEMGAFPGGLADPVYRALGRLVQRLRRTPPIQNGPAPFPRQRSTERAVQRYVDYFEPVGRIQRFAAGETRPGQAALPDLEDAYLQETLRRGRTLYGPRGLEWLEKTHQKPILALIRSKRISMDEADTFLMARAAEEGNKLIRDRNPDNPELTRYGMSDEEAQGILDEIKADPRAAAFEELGRRFDALVRDVRAIWVETGRKSQKDVDELEKAQPHYAPARTDMSDETGKPIQVPSGKKRVGQPFKKALGRESRAEYPLAFQFAQAEQAISQGEINKTRLAFLRFASVYAEELQDVLKIVPVPMQRVLVNGTVRESFDPFFRGRNDVIVAWDKGRPIALEIAAPFQDLAVALNQLGPTQVEGVTRLVALFNRIRSGLITRYRPFFWPRNMIRDAKSAFYLGSEFGVAFSAKVVRDIPLALATLAGKETRLTPFLQRYRAAGAPISFMGMSDLTTKLDQISKGLSNPRTSSGDKAVEGFKAIKEAMNAASDIGENGTRFSAFVHAIEDLGMSDERAAAYAKELQNFERKGLSGNKVNAWYLFANAGIQSTRRFGQAIKNPGVRKMVAASFVFSMGWDLLMRALGGDDDDGRAHWDKIPDYEKQGNFIFMYPDGSGRRVTIPAPFIFGAFNYTGQQLAAMLSGNIGPGKFAASVGNAWINAVNPVGQLSGEDGSGFVRALTPEIGKLPLEVATNRDWRGKPFIREPYDPRTPDSSTSWPDVNPIAKAVAEWLNRVSGGDKFEKGAIDVSAETLEHVAQYLAAGLPQDIADIVAASDKARGGPVSVRDVPLLKSFVREPSPFASWSEQKDLLYTLEAERDRAKEEKRLMSGEVFALIKEAQAMQKKRSEVERPKTEGVVPLDDLPERERLKKLQAFDLEAQTWNKRAREAIRRMRL